MARSLLTLKNINRDDLINILERIRENKKNIRAGKQLNQLNGKVVGLMFEKPSTRTRAGFESAALRLGGKPIYLASSELQLKRGEPIKDVARILGGYMDGIVARVNSHQTVVEFAEHSGVPIINGLCDLAHPTQAICDLFTIQEAKNRLEGLTLTYIGDGNNVCNSLLIGCAMAGMNINVACPDNYRPDNGMLQAAKEWAAKTGAKINITSSVKDASEGSDILYTDTWVSMGEESRKEEKIKAFTGYQINAGLLKIAAKDAIVMHCLPAYRGYEITDDVLEGKQSVAWQQGENKMWSATGILEYFIQ